MISSPTIPYISGMEIYILTENKITRKANNVNWYHRVYYEDANGKRKVESYRCNRVAKGRTKHPKNCHGDYKLKDGNYCQAFRDAQDRVKDLEHATKTQSLQLESLSRGERVEMAQAKDLAKKSGMSMPQIVQIAEQHAGPLKPVSVPDGINAFIRHMERTLAAEGCAADTVRGYKTHLNRIAKKWGRKMVHELRPDELNDWGVGLVTSGKLAPKSQKHTIATGGTWWRWLDNNGYSVGSKNPFEKCVRVKAPRKTPCIIYPDEARQVVTTASDDPYLAAVVVMIMFCGLRTEEACKMAWNWIYLEHPMLEVPAGIAKKGVERFNEFQLGRLNLNNLQLPPNGLAWLRYVKDKSYQIALCGSAMDGIIKGGQPRKDGKVKQIRKKRFDVQQGAILPVNPETFRNKKNKILPMLKGKVNVLRHTFCSMHMAAFKNHPLTAALAGNSVSELKKSYKRPVPQDQAVEYFSIMPPVKKITKSEAAMIAASI